MSRRLLLHHTATASSNTYANNLFALATPLAYFKCDESSGTAIVNYGSVGSANGTYSSVTLANTAGAGTSMGFAPYYDGVASYGTLYSAALAAALNLNLHTVSFWFKAFDASVWSDSNFKFIFSMRGTPDAGLTQFLKNGAASQILSTYPDTKTYTQSSYSPTTWQHVAITRNVAGNVEKTYINGTEVNSQAAASSAATLGGIRIGRVSDPNSGGFYWKGWIQHIAIFGVALSPSSITTLATAA